MVECKICKEEFKNFRSLTWHLKKDHKIDQKSYYDKYLKIENEGICKNCGRETEFRRLDQGYRKYCCSDCQRIGGVRAWRKTMNDKYDGGYYSGTDEYREKRKLDCLEKYNCEYYWQAKEIKEKRKESMLERYGVEHTMQNEEFKSIANEHREETNLERYCVKHNWSSEELREQGQYKTCLEKYGTKYPVKTNEIKEKAKETNLQKYGVEYFTKTKEYLEKTIKTNRQKYGVDWPQQNPEIHKKSLFGKYHAQNGKVYDSSWEYLYEQYLIEHNIPYTYQAEKTLKWNDVEGKEHVYIPDFAIGEDKCQLVEIKGDHFFDKDGNFIDPYNKSDTGTANAKLKWECMMKAGVKVLTSKELLQLGIIL